MYSQLGNQRVCSKTGSSPTEVPNLHQIIGKVNFFYIYSVRKNMYKSAHFVSVYILELIKTCCKEWSFRKYKRRWS